MLGGLMLIRKHIKDLKDDLEVSKDLLYRLRRILINNKEPYIDLYSEEVFNDVNIIKRDIINCDLINSSYSFYGIEKQIDNNIKLNFDIYLSYFIKLLLEICYLKDAELEKIRDYFTPISIIGILFNLEDIYSNILNIIEERDNGQ